MIGFLASLSPISRRIILFAGFLLLYIPLVRLAGRYNNYPHGDWHSEIYADKSGYYIYLPATFLHGYYQGAFPEDIEERMGHGFRFENGKLFTKYPMGVAVLVSPFFLLAHLLALSGDNRADGFSGDYYEMTYYASVFYFMLGAVFLFHFLRRKYPVRVALISILFLLFGTHLYYYAFRDPLMSHVYSFALFSLLLLLTDNFWKVPSAARLIPVALVSGLILLVRPVNAIILPMVLFLGVSNTRVSNTRDLLARVRFLLTPLNLLIMISSILAVMLPQMIYWKFLSGNFLFNAYQDEGFTNWNNPKLAEVLMSPANGLLTYTPGILLIVSGIVWMFFRKEAGRWPAFVYLLAVLYLCSSWYDYRFGCSFGQRSFVEYLALFAIPLTSLIQRSFSSVRRIPGYFLSLVMVYLIYLNIGLTGIYTKCHFGCDWEWPVYRVYYERAGLFPFLNPIGNYHWEDDFEKRSTDYSSRMNILNTGGAYSGTHVSRADTLVKYSDGFSAEADHLVTGCIDRVEVGVRYYFEGERGISALVCSIQTGDSLSFYQPDRLKLETLVPGSWNDVSTVFQLNGVKAFGLIKVYLWRLSGPEIMIDDFRVNVVRKKD